MQRFVKKILCFVVIMALLMSAQIAVQHYVIGNQYETNYQAAILDKMNRLKSVKEPKIVLVGNSNVSFGMCSEMLEEEFHMPVVNLGLHGSMGNAFHENMARCSINENDIIIVCHTNYADDGKISDCSLAWITMEWYNQLWDERLYSDADILDLATAYPNYAVSATERAFLKKLQGADSFDQNTCYARNAFNSYGDVSVRPDTEKYVFDKESTWVPEINDNCIQRLNRLHDYCKKRGATLLVAGYPIADGEFTADKKEYVEFQRRLESELECSVISDFTDYFIPYKYFYNTDMHLTEEGARIRTQQLIEDLKRWQDNQ